MSTSIFRRLALAALGLACAQAGHAVHIDPDGRGQALIFPYYTVNAGKATLLSVINTRDSAKAVRVRFSESRNGAEVMAFNLYLAPFDAWTGAVFSPSAGEDYPQAAPARVASSDNSCTLPELPAGGQDFFNHDYAGQFSPDPGPHELSRTREGFIEVIELGRIENTEGFAAADAIQRGAADRSGCTLLSRAWALPVSPSPQGLWREQPGLGVLSPDGGLQGGVVIVDVALGSSFSVPAVALDGFFEPAADCAPDCRGRGDENLHTQPGYAHPSLAAARSGENDRAVAEFHHHGGRARQMSFTGPDAGLKAVSAVLMRQHLDNTFQQSPANSQSLVARTEWVVTFPTKRLHLARQTPAERLPFRSAYQWDLLSSPWPYVPTSGACEPLRVDYGNREGKRLKKVPGIEFPIMPPRPPVPAFCYSSQVVALNDSARAPDSERLHETLRGDPLSTLLGSSHPLRWRTCAERVRVGPESAALRFNDCSADTASDFTEGWMRLELGDPQRNYLYSTLQPDASQLGSTNLLLGLPAIGFAVSEFEGSGTPGVLANFSTLQEHGGERAPRAGQLNAANPAGGWTPVSGD